MSQENVEIVRRAVEAYIRGDIDAYLGFIVEDVEICPDASVFPEANRFIGREEFRRFLDEIAEGWEGGAHTTLTEIFAIGERVVVRSQWGGKGRESGIAVRSNLTGIYSVRGGQIVRIEFYFDHAKALAAAGLSE
jgi:ketosteroid isomerase-like protein